MDQEHQGDDRLTGAAAVGDSDDLARRVRGEHPSARKLDKILDQITAAYAAHSGARHRLWLEESTGALLFLDEVARPCRTAGHLGLPGHAADE